jgi:hypothetical protein
LKKEIAVSQFRTKAVGQEIINEFETHLRTELSKKHKIFKAEFFRWCKGKAIEFLKPTVEALRRKVNMDEFENFDDFRSELDDLKENYKINGPKFTGSGEIIADTCQSLTIRAAEMAVIQSKKANDGSLRIQQSKLSELETEIKENKNEFNFEK